jgi:hypothetical protein
MTKRKGTQINPRFLLVLILAALLVNGVLFYRFLALEAEYGRVDAHTCVLQDHRSSTATA